MATNNSNLALLIDGDNISHKIIASLMTEVAKYGIASVKRIYCDWTEPARKEWKPCLLHYSITPIQQFAYTSGKNATDVAMIIDAMDLLYTGRFTGFCIVSSDAGFTRLASRIREQGLTVYGFGERKAARPFVAACDKFSYYDTRSGESQQSTVALQQPSESTTAAATTSVSGHGTRRAFGREAVYPLQLAALTVGRDGGYDDGWVDLAKVEIALRQLAPPSFLRDNGCEEIREFIEASGVAEVRTKNAIGCPPITQIQLRFDSSERTP